jgi:hypothetical protein
LRKLQLHKRKKRHVLPRKLHSKKRRRHALQPRLRPRRKPRLRQRG